VIPALLFTEQVGNVGEQTIKAIVAAAPPIARAQRANARSWGPGGDRADQASELLAGIEALAPCSQGMRWVFAAVHREDDQGLDVLHLGRGDSRAAARGRIPAPDQSKVRSTAPEAPASLWGRAISVPGRRRQKVAIIVSA
jgi:hypothetical protein